MSVPKTEHVIIVAASIILTELRNNTKIIKLDYQKTIFKSA
jgi:hypothetical protein